MKKHFWKFEYSILFLIIFSVIVLFIPTSLFPSKEAYFVSRWNEIYNKVDYMFSAMNAQAESDIIKSLKKSQSYQERERLMMLLVKSYLRLEESDRQLKRYKVFYMNGIKSKKTDYYYFDKKFLTNAGTIVGIKETSANQPGFMMMFDVNGLKKPNTWGKDIYGVNIYTDGQVKPLGFEMTLNDIKRDCSTLGTGIACSQYYRIGGEFNED